MPEEVKKPNKFSESASKLFTAKTQPIFITLFKTKALTCHFP